MTQKAEPKAADKTKTYEEAREEVTTAADNIKGEVVEVTFEDYKFKVNTELMDDVDALEMIDDIENNNNMKTIIDFLKYLIGADGYDQLKAHFVKKDGRLKISKLSKIYVAIFDKFDPKD